MEFQRPTNKTQLTSTLKEIYHYYRVQRTEMGEVNLKPLALPILDFVEKTQEQLTEEASVLVSASHQREKNKSQEEIKEKLASVDILIASANENTQSLINKIEELYYQSQEKIREEGVVKGFATSNVVLDKISRLEEEKNQKITDVIQKNQQTLATLESQKAELTVRLSSIDDYFSSLFEKEVNAKVLELHKEQLKHREDINKYNNSISEKIQNSKNSVINAQATLMIKYKEISIPELSKDTLVDMGYYDDVIDCINSYYELLDPEVAYQDLLNDRALMVYLDDYYDDLVYAYKLKANL